MLTPEQIAQYHREGFVIIPNFMTAQEVAAYHAEMDRIAQGNTLASHDKTRMEMEPDQPAEGMLIRRIYEPCTHYDSFRALSESPKLLDSVEKLVGPDILFHYSKINMKPPRIGSVVEWHQDLSYYPLTNRDSVTVLFYLDDASVTNGCLQILPRRHHLPLLTHSTDGFFRGKVTESVDASDAILIEGAAGTVIFISCMTPHASVVNTSNQSRRTLILSYRATDAFPIHCHIMTDLVEKHVRLVRGQRSPVARFTMTEFPIPVYENQIASLYELQERSRKKEQAA
ncbi:MAG: phytanoyl-CoA dioxygenase family protein [candidate division Zixibacteria bacterium]|nr:phytanoyl-CoA dioxygenase family protein [candidate division Zixibacteria bacterium]